MFLFGKNNSSFTKGQMEYKKSVVEEQKRNEEAEKESVAWVERIKNNPFVDTIEKLVEESVINNSKSSLLLNVNNPNLVAYIIIESDLVSISGKPYYYDNYNLPKLESLGSQLGLAKCIKSRIESGLEAKRIESKIGIEGYSCSLMPHKYTPHVSIHNDDIPIPRTTGYIIYVNKRRISNNNVTGNW